MSDFDPSLMEDLIAESKEHLDTIEPDLMQLEETAGQASGEVINRVFRAVHSIKGGFGFFGLTHIKDLAHVMENVLGQARDGSLSMNAGIVDVLLTGLDKLRVLIADVDQSQTIPIETELAGLQAILDASQEEPVANPSGPPSENASGQSAASERGTSSGPPPEVPASYFAAMELLETPGDDILGEEATEQLGACLRDTCALATGTEGKSRAEALLGGYEACRDSMGLDGLLREALALNLKELKDYLIVPPAPGDEDVPAAAASTGSMPAKTTPAATTTGSMPTKAGRAPESLRVRVDLLDRLMNLAGELVLSRNQIKQVLGGKLQTCLGENQPLRRLQDQVAKSKAKLSSLDGAPSDAARWSAVVAREFSILESCLAQLLDQKLTGLPVLNSVVQDMDLVTSELQNGVMSTRMQPVGSVFSKFPRVIRDMNRKLGKQIDLEIRGERVELDKSIIEALGDPLTHLIRNSADHGVEPPEVRRAAGKPANGTLHLSARHEGGQVFVEIADDGAGIDPERVVAKAIERGLITPQAAADMSTREILRLIFAPGFSMAREVSDISGRGVGMDVVRSNIERIGGSVDIESVVGQGTRIILRLPLTLAIMPALIVRNGGKTYAVPQVDIEELVRVRPGDTDRKIENVRDNPVIRLRGALLPLVSLTSALGDLPLSAGPASAPARRATNVLVLKAGPHRYGLVVDELQDSQEIVVKPLPDYLGECRCYAGATIMGDGSVAMILDAGGTAVSANLRFGGRLDGSEQGGESSDRRIAAESESMLMVRNGTPETLAIPLNMVARVEKISAQAIERVGQEEYLKYADYSMRLLRLEEYMSIQAPGRDQSEYFVVVPKQVRHPMGILVSAIEDIVEVSATLDRDTVAGPGVLGSITLDGRLLVCIDIHDLFERAAPQVYGPNRGRTTSAPEGAAA